MSESIRFPDGTWTFKEGDHNICGQHYIGEGSCNFIRYHLIDSNIAKMFRKIIKERDENKST